MNDSVVAVVVGALILSYLLLEYVLPKPGWIARWKHKREIRKMARERRERIRDLLYEKDEPKPFMGIW